MNNRDFYKNITIKLADPTQSIDAINELNSALDSDFADIAKLKSDYDSQLNSLRDTNAKLALRLTDGYKPENNPDEQFYNDIENKFREVVK